MKRLIGQCGNQADTWFNNCLNDKPIAGTRDSCGWNIALAAAKAIADAKSSKDTEPARGATTAIQSPGAATTAATPPATIPHDSVTVRGDYAQGHYYEKHSYLNPGDADWCKSAAATDLIIRALGRLRDLYLQNAIDQSMWLSVENERVVAIEDIGAGTSFCATNAPSACRPHTENHYCHGTAVLKDGRRVAGIFTAGRQLGDFQFASDAGRRADGY